MAGDQVQQANVRHYQSADVEKSPLQVADRIVEVTPLPFRKITGDVKNLNI
jgi:hypothetical protein